MSIGFYQDTPGCGKKCEDPFTRCTWEVTSDNRLVNWLYGDELNDLGRGCNKLACTQHFKSTAHCCMWCEPKQEKAKKFVNKKDS